MTWDDFANLTAGQRAKLEQFAAIGTAQSPDFSTVTRTQARTAHKDFLVPLNQLVDPAREGIRKAREHFDRLLVKADDDANPV